VKLCCSDVTERVSRAEPRLIRPAAIEHSAKFQTDRTHAVKRMLHVVPSQTPDA